MKKILALLMLTWLSPAIGAVDDEEQKQLLNLPPEMQSHISKYVLAGNIKQDLFDRPLLKRILLPVGSEKHVIAYLAHRSAYKYGSSVNSAAFNHDGTKIASTGGDRIVRIWDTHTGKELLVLQGRAYAANSAVFNHNGTLIASAWDDGIIRIWDAHTGECLLVLQGHPFAVNSVDFNNQGTHIISASNDGTVRIWGVKTGKTVCIFPAHEGSEALAAKFNKQGTQVVVGYADGTIRLWDIKTGNTIHILHGHERLPWQVEPGPGHVFSVEFNNSGTQVLSAGIDRTIRLWDAQVGTLMLTLRGHKRWVKSARFNPQETSIVSASNDGTVRIWDATTGQELYTLRGHESWVSSADFDNSGNQIVSASHDGSVRIWDTRILPYEQYHFSLEQAIWIYNEYHKIMNEDKKRSKKPILSEGEIDFLDSPFNFYCFALSQPFQEDVPKISKEKENQIMRKLEIEQSIKKQYPEIVERLAELRAYPKIPMSLKL